MADRSSDENETSRFSREEQEAMRERSRELKRKKGSKGDNVSGEQEVLSKIQEMEEHDRIIAERIHKLIRETAPSLVSRTWYGMPAYARDGNVVCFFQNARKFKTRYATLGFSDKANLDNGEMWATTFAIMEFTDEVEKRIRDLLKKALE